MLPSVVVALFGVLVVLGVVTVVGGGVGEGVSGVGGRIVMGEGASTFITALIAGNIMSLVTDGRMTVPLGVFAL